MRNHYLRLILILIIVSLSLWVDTRAMLVLKNPATGDPFFQRDVRPRLGLDLRGGLQVVMEADLPADTPISAANMEAARTIIENRTNALGVAENVIQVVGERRLVGEFPGLEDAAGVLETIQKTGLMEFVDFGYDQPLPGTIVKTDFGMAPTTPEDDASPETATPVPAAEATDTPPAETTPETTPTPTEAGPAPEGSAPEETVYHTIMTGSELATVAVETDPTYGYVIYFTLTPKGRQIFADYTASHVGQYLGIVLDKEVISAPRVEEAIPEGEGIIRGSFTRESANAFAVQLRYGSLPVPLKIIETRLVGPTLGEDSLQKSLVAGLAGMIIVILFMLLYYRLPGAIANIAILVYAAIAFAIFKYFHFTLTLPGIAGFLLSTGSALDANILMFERFKEELRAGRKLGMAVEQGWKRAWPSIRDSNIATIITSAILFWFGNTFGATIVKGFAVTLALGVIVSLFTAIMVTRTLLALVFDWFKIKEEKFRFWFGL